MPEWPEGKLEVSVHLSIHTSIYLLYPLFPELSSLPLLISAVIGQMQGDTIDKMPVHLTAHRE